MSWVLAFLFFLACAALVLALARRGRAQTGLPQGRVIYADTGGWQRPQRPLFSQAFRLTGKPDYLVTEGAGVIPVEVKSGRAPAQPYRSHVLQLAAYCLLVEEHYGRRPDYGIIKYADRAFEIDYTPPLAQELLATLEDMRADLAAGDAPRNHDDPRRCAACGHNGWCEQRLL
jgi:CRISPR-associated exonuclease Cas4